MDLVFSSAPGGMVGVLLGKGDGTFLPARLFEGCPASYGIVVADFNRDGHPDIAVACFDGNFVLVLWGKGDGTFPLRTEVPVPGGPRYLAVGDLTGDGWPGLAVSSFGEGSLYALLNHAGQFSSTLLGHFDATCAVTVADLSRDGRMDVIAGVRDHGRLGLALFQGNQNGSFKYLRLLEWGETTPAMPMAIQVADLGGNGIPDILASLTNGEVGIFRGRGRGEFSKPTSLIGSSSTGEGRDFVLADLDLDGKLDFLVTDPPTESLMFFSGVGRGEFALRGSMVVGKLPFQPVVADFNNDHLPDIVVNTMFEGRSLFLKADWKKDVSR